MPEKPIGKRYEIRDPIHGFVDINEWERDIINHPVFQRLRRIRQLAWTDMVYPGASHTRFEHSLGVMHVATKMFKRIKAKRGNFLKKELLYEDAGLARDLVKVRLACLLHDVGHPPFSHASENLMPTNPLTGKTYTHEEYSSAIIKHLLKDLIDDHKVNQLNYGLKASDISNFLIGDPSVGTGFIWRELLSSQLDADRADYLLRDSHHIGVAYGRYDLNRLLVTLTIAKNPETEDAILAVESGGMHAAEGLILARYMMFTQVYFQHTRRAYDYHIEMAVKELLAEHQKGSDLDQKDKFPPPTSLPNIKSYLDWTDWLVLGHLANGSCGEHGKIIWKRQHHRSVYQTPEVPEITHFEFTKKICDKLQGMVAFVDQAQNSWYKFSKEQEIQIVKDAGSTEEKLVPLSKLSSVVAGLKPIKQTRVYVPLEHKAEAAKIIATLQS